MAEVEVGGIRLHVQRLGNGETPVVFLHGLVMDNLSSWYFTVANPVAGFADAILYDLRGHGRSSRPADGYRLDTFIDDLSDLLDSLDVHVPVILVGNSFGALLAIAFTLTYPERVDGLVLVDALLPEPGWPDAMISTLGLQGEAADTAIAEGFKHWLGRHSERKRNRLAVNARALVEQTSMLADLSTSPTWPDDIYASITCPVLAIYGAESDQADRGPRLAAQVRDCELHMLPGCTHSVIWEANEQVTQLITAWLQARLEVVA